MRSTPELDARAGLEKLAGYPFHVLTWVGEDGYPVSVAVEASVDAAAGSAAFPPPAGLSVPTDRPVSLVMAPDTVTTPVNSSAAPPSMKNVLPSTLVKVTVFWNVEKKG